MLGLLTKDFCFVLVYYCFYYFTNIENSKILNLRFCCISSGANSGLFFVLLSITKSGWFYLAVRSLSNCLFLFYFFCCSNYFFNFYWWFLAAICE